MFKLFEPNKIFKITSKAPKYVLFLFVVVLTIGLVEALVISPEDYKQSDAVRIMYVHVPAAWISLGIFSGITLEGSLGRTNTELTKYIDPITGLDLSGNKAPFVPELDASIAANFKHDSGIFARLELIHQGEIYFSDQNDPTISENGYTLLNATLGYRSESGYEISIFGGNLTDETYYVNISPDIRAGTVGIPQMFGVRARWEY